MEISFNVQPTLPSKNKIVPDLSERDCTYWLQKKMGNKYLPNVNLVLYICQLAT
jgi:hypothetical protein